MNTSLQQRDLKTRFSIWVLSMAIIVMMVPMSGCGLIPTRFSIEPEPLPPTNQPINYFLSTYFNDLRPQRVVVVSPRRRDGLYSVQGSFADAFAKQLRANGILEAIVHEGNCGGSMDLIRRGSFDEVEMMQLAAQYNADGVLFCDVSAFSGYQPLGASVSVALIDTRESIVTLAADGTWDVNNPAVMDQFKKFTCKRHSLQPFAKNIYLQSPREFTDFVATDFAEFAAEVFSVQR